MSVRPYKGKKKKPGEIWWTIDINRPGQRHVPFQGSYSDAKDFEKVLRGSETIVPHICKVSDLIIPYLAWYETERSKTTLRDIKFSINLYIVPVFGNLAPSQLTVQLFNEFKAKLFKNGLTKRTINKHLDYFSGMLRWSAENEYCLPLTIKIPKFPKKLTTPREKVTPLTSRQLNALYAHIAPEYRLLFLLMSDQGLRLDEALQIQVEEIDENRQMLTVVGKGNKRRVVPFMSDRFETELDQVLSARLEGHLIVNPRTGEPYKTMWKELKRAAAAAGLKRKVNHHILRHSFATLAAESGMNPHALQRILGHSSIETTNKIYTNVGHDFIGDEAQKMREKTKILRSAEKAPRNHLKLLG